MSLEFQSLTAFINSGETLLEKESWDASDLVSGTDYLKTAGNIFEWFVENHEDQVVMTVAIPEASQFLDRSPPSPEFESIEEVLSEANILQGNILQGNILQGNDAGILSVSETQTIRRERVIEEPHEMYDRMSSEERASLFVGMTREQCQCFYDQMTPEQRREELRHRLLKRIQVKAEIVQQPFLLTETL